MNTTERHHLAQLIRQVAVGTIAIEYLEYAAIQYDDGSLFHELLLAEIDALAEHPAEFRTSRFRGRKRPDTRRRKSLARKSLARMSLARMSLFLDSDSKYKWPPYSGSPVNSCDPLLLIVTGLLTSCGLFIIAVSPMISLLFLAMAIATFSFSQRLLKSACEKWIEHHDTIGNLDLWPFRHDNDYNKALANPLLLNGCAEFD